MVRSTKEKREKVLRLGAEMLQQAGSSMQQEAKVERRYAVLARELSDLGSRVTSLDSTTNLQVFQDLGLGAKRIASLLPKIAAADQPQPKQIADLLDSLDSAGAAIVSLATGLSGNGKGSRARKLATQAASLAAQGGDAAFELYLGAEYIRHSLGLPPIPGGFEYPQAGGCGCGGAAMVPPAALPPKKKKLQPAPAGPLDLADIRDALGNIETASHLTPDFLHGVGLYMLAMTTLICNDLCTPAPALASCAFGAANSANDGTNWIPTFTVTWTGCCTCSCFKFWTQNKSITWTTDHTVKPAAAIPNTRPRAPADAIAKNSGTAEVNAYNASFFPPAAPPGGGAAPAPPPFKPNAAINPALNTVVCPTC